LWPPRESRGPGSAGEKDPKVGGNRSTTANILVQKEDDETTILVRILKDGSRLVYQQIDPPQDVIKLIKEVTNIDLDLFLPTPTEEKTISPLPVVPGT
jgi:hypothetical protein